MALLISYTAGDDNHAKQYGNEEVAQTFTAPYKLEISALWMRIYRIGSPGTVSFALYTTDASGHPDSYITGVGFNSVTLTTDAAGEWKELSLPGNIELSKDVKYALRVSGGDDISNCVCWRYDDGDASFANGTREHSTDNAANWTTHTNDDLMFKIYGTQIFAPPVDISTVRRLIAVGNNEVWYEDI